MTRFSTMKQWFAFYFLTTLLCLCADRGISFSPASKKYSSRRAFSGPKGGYTMQRLSRPTEQPGSPPASAVTQGGPPQNGSPQSKGGPPGGPPSQSKGGPPGGSKGGPPAPTKAQQFLESAFDVGFKLLYLGDDSGIQDSSKNLRVLWTRALLHNLGQIDDPIASELLPRKTKWVVGTKMANMVWKDTPAVEKLDWIVNRTVFIDTQLNEYLGEETTTTTNNKKGRRQVVLLGSGYDTRSLRYSQQKENVDIDIYEIDLPEIISMKSKMVTQYLLEKQQSPSPNNNNDNSNASIKFVPLDLNEVFTKNKSVVEELQKQGFRDDISTMIVCEAVLFYLIPGAAQKIFNDLFHNLSNVDRYCITDNLAKVGIAPGPPVPTPRDKCESWLKDNGKELLEHDSIWGGAIHFVGAK